MCGEPDSQCRWSLEFSLSMERNEAREADGSQKWGSMGRVNDMDFILSARGSSRWVSGEKEGGSFLCERDC